MKILSVNAPIVHRRHEQFPDALPGHPAIPPFIEYWHDEARYLAEPHIVKTAHIDIQADQIRDRRAAIDIHQQLAIGPQVFFINPYEFNLFDSLMPHCNCRYHVLDFAGIPKPHRQRVDVLSLVRRSPVTASAGISATESLDLDCHLVQVTVRTGNPYSSKSSTTSRM